MERESVLLGWTLSEATLLHSWANTVTSTTTSYDYTFSSDYSLVVAVVDAYRDTTSIGTSSASIISGNYGNEIINVTQKHSNDTYPSSTYLAIVIFTNVKSGAVLRLTANAIKCGAIGKIIGFN